MQCYLALKKTGLSSLLIYTARVNHLVGIAGIQRSMQLYFQMRFQVLVLHLQAVSRHQVALAHQVSRVEAVSLAVAAEAEAEAAGRHCSPQI